MTLSIDREGVGLLCPNAASQTFCQRLTRHKTALVLLGLWPLLAGWPLQAAEFDGHLLAAVRLTLENAPDIALSEQQIQASQGRLLAAQSEFVPVIYSGVGGQSVHTPLPQALRAGGQSEINGDTFNYSVGASKKLYSGIIVNPELSVNRSSDNYGNTSVPNSGNLALNFTVPLLKDSGSLVNTANMSAAQLELDSAAHDYRFTLSAKIASTVIAYWDCLAAKKLLDISAAAEQRSKEFLDSAHKLANADEIPQAEVKRYETQLAGDTIARISAEQALVAARAGLALAMQLPDQNPTAVALPTDDFPVVGSADLASLDNSASVQHVIETAAQQRLDVQAISIRQQAANILLAAARQNNRTQLDLNLSIGYSGLTEGSAIANTVTALQPKGNGPNAAVSVNLAFPVTDNAYRSAIVQRAAAAEQNSIQTKALQNAIRNNIHVHINALRLSAAQWAKAKFQADTQFQVLENEKKRYKLGVGSVLDIIYNNAQLSVSQANAVYAARDFSQAVIRFRFETGQLLEPLHERQSLDMAALTTLPTTVFRTDAP
ncbi:MAG: TolC family protein [Methylovulum sp.]|nr:TolC family protein [Methylovulum sp.]